MTESMLYRFRSVEQVLDKYNELQNQEIYFADPAELNDPIEGLRNVVWQGTTSEWVNLFELYVLSLHWTVQCYHMTAGKLKIDLDYCQLINPLAG